MGACSSKSSKKNFPDGPGRTLSEPKPAAAAAPAPAPQPLSQSQGHRLGGDPEKSPAVPAPAVLAGGDVEAMSDREKRAAEAAAAADRRRQKDKLAGRQVKPKVF